MKKYIIFSLVCGFSAALQALTITNKTNDTLTVSFSAGCKTESKTLKVKSVLTPGEPTIKTLQVPDLTGKFPSATLNPGERAEIEGGDLIGINTKGKHVSKHKISQASHWFIHAFKKELKKVAKGGVRESCLPAQSEFKCVEQAGSYTVVAQHLPGSVCSKYIFK